MDQNQIVYFRQRLNELAEQKILARETELFGPSGIRNGITWGMVFAAIKAGEITLKEGTDTLTRPYLMPTDVNWPELEVKRALLEQYRKEVAADRQRAMDAVMLPADAGAVLSKFAAG
jgi:hypothetical protein